MQLDLQSVEKVPFSTLAWALAPKMLKIGCPCLRMSPCFLQDLSTAVSRLSTGPVAGNHRQHFFDPTRTNNITIAHGIFDLIGECNRIWPSWIENVLTVISCNWATGEAGNSSGILEKGPNHSGARKTNFQHFRGQSSCKHIERCFFNGLQIQLHNNWL